MCLVKYRPQNIGIFAEMKTEYNGNLVISMKRFILFYDGIFDILDRLAQVRRRNM